MEKVEGYLNDAREEFQEAMRYKEEAGGSDKLAIKPLYYQMATYHILEAIYHQNQVIIELLKK